MISTAVSVASFSVVLGETFAAVGLSTIIPNTFAIMAKLAVGAAAGPALDNMSDAIGGIGARIGDGAGGITLPSGNDVIGNVLSTLKDAAANVDKIDLLMPKTATIDAEFEFQGREVFQGGVSVGAMVQVVTINAGYSALYESSSRNQVKLHIEYATVEIGLR